MTRDHMPDGGWSLAALLAAEAADQELDFLYFWGHTPKRSNAVGPHVFSQWFESDFSIDGTVYPSAEHYMMAAKAELFGDAEMREAIVRAPSPGEAKALGRKVRGFDSAQWDAHRLGIVTRGSIAKFDAQDDLRKYLLSTGDRVLVEASPVDPIWGIGLAHDDARAARPSQWQGLNLLGFALMAARAELANREAS